MKLLQELHNLHEGAVPGENHVELANLVKHFPSNYKKAIEKLWGGPRLTYHGIPFFGDSDSIYGDLLDKALKNWADDGGELHIELSNVEYAPEDGDPVDIEVSYDQPIDPMKDGQEVYMGYDANEDCLYVGLDVSASEEFFNDEWDKAFKEATGEDFDYDNKEHQKAFTAARQEMMKHGHWMLFKLTENGGEFSAELADDGLGTFYHGDPNGYGIAKNMGFIDLRLD